MSKMASLILEDGTTFKGLRFGANVSVSGEVGEFFLVVSLLELLYVPKCCLDAGGICFLFE